MENIMRGGSAGPSTLHVDTDWLALRSLSKPYFYELKRNSAEAAMNKTSNV